MELDTLLSTIILVSFLVTIIMAIGSYIAYKLREGRQPAALIVDGSDEVVFFQRVRAEDLTGSSQGAAAP